MFDKKNIIYQEFYCKKQGFFNKKSGCHMEKTTAEV